MRVLGTFLLQSVSFCEFSKDANSVIIELKRGLFESPIVPLCNFFPMKVTSVHAHGSRWKSPVPGLRPFVKAVSYSQYTMFLFMISLSFSTLPSVDTPYPMLILCGPPGSGKRYLARRLCQEFPDFFGFG